MSVPLAMSKYFSEDVATYVWDLINRLKVVMKIVTPRKTKLGDCRYPRRGAPFIVITVNNDLLPFHFLITTIHELAHAKVYRDYGSGVQAHGVEWKRTFKELFDPIIEGGFLTVEENSVLKKTLINPRASTCDQYLTEFLNRKNDTTLLKDLNIGDYFSTRDGVKYQINEKVRKRFICTRLFDRKLYRVHSLSEVEHLVGYSEPNFGSQFHSLPKSKTTPQYNDGKVFLWELSEGDVFRFKTKIFIKGKKLRTRYECVERATHYDYVVPGEARVVLMR